MTLPKKISIGLMILCSYFTNAQSLSYSDLGILFSEENYRGTARFNSMSGAFGALGGDVSALYLNPAGGAVFNNSQFSGSLGFHTTETNSDYYGTKNFNELTKTRIPQMGVVFVFDNVIYNSPWKKYAFGFNYSMTNDFSNSYQTFGNNSNTFSTFFEHPYDSRDPKSKYNIAEKQNFVNKITGSSRVYNFSLSSVYEDLLYVGGSVNFHQTDLIQNTWLTEYNKDADGNTLIADYSQYISQLSSGISLGVGVIAKPIKNVRLGLAYQSPVWHYDTNEETNITPVDGFEGDTFIQANDVPDDYTNTDLPAQYTALRYKIKSPSKTTASFAYLFNTLGLVSIDYSVSDFKSIQIGETGDFSDENISINNNLNSSVETLKIGTEWRYNNWSFRGGYSIKDSPFLNAKENEKTKGYSLGIGISGKRTKFDISYENANRVDYYDFYGEYDEIDAAQLDLNTAKITATLSFSL